MISAPKKSRNIGFTNLELIHIIIDLLRVTNRFVNLPTILLTIVNMNQDDTDDCHTDYCIPKRGN